MKLLKQIKKIISYYTWAFKIAINEKKSWMISAVVAYSLIFLMPNIELIISKLILERIESQQISISYIAVLLSLAFIVYVSIDIGNVIYMLFYEKIRYVISNKLFEKVMWKANSLSLEVYDTAEGNEFLERLILSSRYDLHNLISSNLTFYSEITQVAVYVIMILMVAPIMAIPMVVVSIVPYCYRMNEAEENSNLEYNIQGLKRKNNYLDSIMTDGKAIKEFRIYNSFNKVKKKWENICQTLFNKRYRHFLKWNRLKVFYNCASQLLNLIILALLIIFKYSGYMDFSTVFFLWNCQMGLNQAVRWFATIVPNSYDAVRKIEECRSFIEQSVCDEIDSNKEDLHNAEGTNQFEIQISHVYYKYEQGDFEIKDVCLQLQQNKVVALLGENGSGKSTLIKLILGLYSPCSGTIRYLIGGKDISPKDFFSCTFQDYSSYHLSLRENVGFGNINYVNDDRRIELHLSEANCQDVFEYADYNLDTILGRLFDLNGKELSGGQWQRLANARAFYSQRCVLIFDEPTARLDPLAELEQIKDIKNIVSGKTIILVSHRIGFARMADTIYYMEKGKILECGSHNELIKKRGPYYNLFESQAQWYDWDDYDD